MDLERVVFEHLQEHLPEMLQELVVGPKAFEDLFVGASEGDFGEVAGEEAPVRRYAPSVRRTEEDDALG